MHSSAYSAVSGAATPTLCGLKFLNTAYIILGNCCWMILMGMPLEDCHTWTRMFAHGEPTIRGNLSTTTNCSCDMHPTVTDFKWFSICNAPLVPSWILAVVIGVTAASMFHRLGPSVTGSLSYAVTFATYAVMISSGLIVHCLYLVECDAQTPTKVFAIFGKADVSLTSCIACSFLINGLVDLNLVRERSWGFFLSSFLLYSATFLAYFMNLLPVMFLYFATIVICCSLYLICQVAVIVQKPFNFKALLFLLLASIFGGGSLWLIRERACWLCIKLGAWSIEGVWYYGSDVSMLFLALYIWNTRTKKPVALNVRSVKP